MTRRAITLPITLSAQEPHIRHIRSSFFTETLTQTISTRVWVPILAQAQVLQNGSWVNEHPWDPRYCLNWTGLPSREQQQHPKVLSAVLGWVAPQCIQRDLPVLSCMLEQGQGNTICLHTGKPWPEQNLKLRCHRSLGRAKETVVRCLCVNGDAFWGNIQGNCASSHVKFFVKYTLPVSLQQRWLDSVHSAAMSWDDFSASQART